MEQRSHYNPFLLYEHTSKMGNLGTIRSLVLAQSASISNVTQTFFILQPSEGPLTCELSKAIYKINILLWSNRDSND